MAYGHGHHRNGRQAEPAWTPPQEYLEKKEMPMDAIEQINELLRDWALFPELRAIPITGKPSYWLLEDTQETTGFRSPEGCHRALTLLGSSSRPEEPTLEEIFQALAPNILDDEEQAQIEWQRDGGYLWRG